MKKEKILLDIERAKRIIDENTPCTARELNDTIKALTDASDGLPNWLVVVLKVIVYALGLILAGVGTAATASCCFPNIF